MEHKVKKKLWNSIAVNTTGLLGAVVICQQTIADDAELAKKLQNPIAALISVPIKLDWDTGIGETDADRSTYVIQPVIPVSINDKLNMISRTIVPVYIDAESPFTGSKDVSGHGDILQTFFFSPKEPTSNGWIWGAGPVLSLPTANEDSLGTEQYSVGPSAIMLKQQNGWTYGGLTNHLWSVAGNDDRADVSATFLQPFISFTTKTQTTFGLNTESLYDWESEQWTVPINISVGQLVKIGKQPVSFVLGYRNYVDGPDNGPDWGVRFQMTLLFPK